MSKTSKIKECIITQLSDHKSHEVSEIKKRIRDSFDEELGEGVIASALRTMTIAGIVEKPERGKYKLLKQEGEEDTNIIEVNDKDCLKHQIIELTQQYEQNVIQILNNIEITEQNMEDIKERIELRKKIEKMCYEIMNM